MISDSGTRPQVRDPLQVGLWLALALVTIAISGCGKTASAGPEPTPTYVPQPTPDRTMEAIIAGKGSPVAFQPPLEVKGSPTPIAGPTRSTNTQRSAGATPVAKPSGGSGSSAPSSSGATRERTPEPAAAPRPTVAPAVTRAAPPPTRPPAAPSNTAPAIINATSVLPGGPARPAGTPAR